MYFVTGVDTLRDFKIVSVLQLDYREVHSWIDIVDEMRDGNLTDVFVNVPSSPGKGYNVLVSPIKIAHEWGSVS